MRKRTNLMRILLRLTAVALFLVALLATVFTDIHSARAAGHLWIELSPADGGRVTDDQEQIDCPSDCATEYEGSAVVLTAYPAPGYRFSYWSVEVNPGDTPPPVFMQGNAKILANIGGGSLQSTGNPLTLFLQGDTGVVAHFVTGEENHAPIFTSITEKTVYEGSLLTFDVLVTDPEQDPVQVGASSLPRGASFNGSTFSWTPDYTQAGYYGFTFSAADGRGGRSSLTVTIRVIDVNAPPVLRPIGNKTIRENETLTFMVFADDPDKNPLNFWVLGLPRGASFVSQVFSWTPDYAQAGTYRLTFLVTDGIKSDSEEVIITVLDVNREPVLAPIGNKSVSEGVPLTFTVTAADPDIASLTYWATGLPTGASFSGQIFTWVPTNTQAGTYRVTFFVSDGIVTDSEQITITVTDTLSSLYRTRIPLCCGAKEKNSDPAALLSNPDKMSCQTSCSAQLLSDPLFPRVFPCNG
jgi:hypothetical protein